MASDPQAHLKAETHPEHGSVEMPRPTVAPMVLSLGLVLLAAGGAPGPGFLMGGGVILATGIAMWIAQLLRHQGHVPEPLVEPAQRPKPVTGQAGTVALLREGVPGYRLRLP